MMDVVSLGELLIDFTCTGTDADGYPAMQAHPGGAVANFLGALAKFGAKTALLGKVGEDAFGKLLVGTLKSAGICADGIVIDKRYFTTLAFVTLDKTGDREFSFARKPGADTKLSADEVRFDLIDRAKVFHFGTLSLTDQPARMATQAAVAYAKEKGKLITYDPNLRKPLWRCMNSCRRQLLWGLAQADVVKISDNEVEFLFGMTPQAGAKYILENYPVKLVFVTCGGDGCYFANQKASGWVSALPGITPVDTTGAGDIFGGSAIWKLLQLGQDPEMLTQEQLRQITAFACAAAGLSTQRPGGLSAVPSYEEVLAALK